MQFSFVGFFFTKNRNGETVQKYIPVLQRKFQNEEGNKLSVEIQKQRDRERDNEKKEYIKRKTTINLHETGRAGKKSRKNI